MLPLPAPAQAYSLNENLTVFRPGGFFPFCPFRVPRSGPLIPSPSVILSMNFFYLLPAP